MATQAKKRISYKWHPIEDLPPDHLKLASRELASLAEVWREQRQLLEASGALKVFTERLERQWAIETGVIERVYTLDRGITELLIEHGIDARSIPQSATDRDPQLVAQIIQDHKHVIDGLFAFVKGNRKLTTGYIKELHAALMQHQPTSRGVDQFGRQMNVALEAGVYKSLPNSPTREDGSVHEYAPPEQVASEMDRLVVLHRQHEQNAVAPEVEAAWLHHRFTQIHPFQDGNGRVARALSSLVFLRRGWFPLTVTRDDLTYISALEAADHGDLAPLVNLFAAIQRRSFVGALSAADSALQHQQVDRVIEAARDAVIRKQEALRREWDQAKQIAGHLQAHTQDRFEKVGVKLTQEIGQYLSPSRFAADSEDPHGVRSHWFRWQIIQTAKTLNYFADTSTYKAWTRLILKTDTQAEILVSFHSIGHEFRGVLVASMCFFRREETERAEREVADLTTLSGEVFQINYREDQAQAEERFGDWLDRGLARGLEVWRTGL